MTTTTGPPAGENPIRSTTARNGFHRWLIAAFVGAYVAVQVLLPGIVLWAGGSQFRWAMFETYRPVPSFFVESTDGRTIVIELGDVVVRARGDVDYPSVVPPHLCRTIPGARSVRTEAAGLELGIWTCE